MKKLTQNQALEKIMDLVTHEKSVLIFGEEGIGKTFFLRRVKQMLKYALYIKAGTKSSMSSKIDEHIIEIDKIKKEFYEGKLVKRILRIKEYTLLLDDADSMDKRGRDLIRKIMKENWLVIASSKKPIDLPFDETIRLAPLDANECHKLAKSILKQYITKDDIPREFYIKAIEKSKRNPKRIAQICSEAVIYYRLGEINFDSDKSINSFFKKIKPNYKFKVWLPPPWIFMVSSYLFLIGRYTFYRVREFETGYLLAIFGYVILATYRAIKYRKSKW